MVPADAGIRPAIERSNVDLPDPVRPRSPTICPCTSCNSMPSSTKSSPPSARGKVWRSAWISRSALLMRKASTKPELAFGVEIKRTPERAIDENDEQAHHRDTEHDAVEVAGLGLLRNIRAETLRFEMLVAPACDLGHDACIPRAARSSDGAGDVVGQHRRQRDPPPP